jgi:predicted RNase H-like nuclease (RuvC/YqgF family)
MGRRKSKPPTLEQWCEDTGMTPEEAWEKRGEDLEVSKQLCTDAISGCDQQRKRAEAAEKERDEFQERARHDAADIGTLGQTCDRLRGEVERLTGRVDNLAASVTTAELRIENLSGELREIAEMCRGMSDGLSQRIVHKIEGIPGLEVKR